MIAQQVAGKAARDAIFLSSFRVIHLPFMIAASAALALAAPGIASADPSAPAVSGYGYLGYAGTSVDGFDVGSVQGRLGARFGNVLGVEGELAGGVKTDDNSVGGLNVHAKLRHQEAGHSPPPRRWSRRLPQRH